MSYTLFWPDSVLDLLTDQYLAARLAGRGDEFRRAVQGLESDLARDPFAVGESRDRGGRLVYDLPASLRYSVDVADRVVTIQSVAYHP